MSRILIIDDDTQIRTLLRKTLEPEGYTVVDVPNGKEGIRRQLSDPFDLVIVDIIMPDKEGVSTIIELKRSDPDLKIIAISGGGSFEPWGYLDIARRVGAHRTLPKPFTPTEMLQSVRDLI